MSKKTSQQAENSGTPPDASKQAERPAGAVDHPALKVRASVPRRHRAGLAFGNEPVIIPASTLTAEQMEAIVNDPFLGVSEASPGKKDAETET